jgi:uncharacterized membrane protein YwzB
MNTMNAALINLGNSPLIGLIVLCIVVGFVVWLALWLLDNFGGFIAQPFHKAARMLIILIGVLAVLDRALEVIFGISLL